MLCVWRLTINIPSVCPLLKFLMSFTLTFLYIFLFIIECNNNFDLIDFRQLTLTLPKMELRIIYCKSNLLSKYYTYNVNNNMYYIPLIFSLQHLKMRFWWASTMDFWIRDFVSSLRSLAEIKVTYLNSFKQLSNVTVHFCWIRSAFCLLVKI